MAQYDQFLIHYILFSANEIPNDADAFSIKIWWKTTDFYWFR